MEIRPILSTLRRHKTAAALIVLEIALSCAIICNAVFLISTRIDRMNRPSGLVENEQRFSYEDMASYEQIKVFAAALSALTGYNKINEQYESNIVLQPPNQADKPLRLKVLSPREL